MFNDKCFVNGYKRHFKNNFICHKESYRKNRGTQ